MYNRTLEGRRRNTKVQWGKQVIIGLAVAVVCFAGLGMINASPRSHYLVVEYQKAVTGGGGVTVVNVVFYAETSKDLADKSLRTQLQFVVDAYKPKADVLAYGWLDVGTGEKKVGESLVYSAKDGSISTTAAHFAK